MPALNTNFFLPQKVGIFCGGIRLFLSGANAAYINILSASNTGSSYKRWKF
jgi:hypothetical protein